jgi:hypothetical protein
MKAAMTHVATATTALPQSLTGKIGKAEYRYANHRKGDAGEVQAIVSPPFLPLLVRRPYCVAIAVTQNKQRWRRPRPYESRYGAPLFFYEFTNRGGTSICMDHRP